MDARHPVSVRATLRPGYVVLVVDVSAGGVLIEGARPLRPGSRVHLQVAASGQTFGVVAHVLRCAVWSLDSSGVTYRGALKFEDRCEWIGEAATPGGSALPTDDRQRLEARGHSLPGAAGRARLAQRRTAK